MSASRFDEWISQGDEPRPLAASCLGKLKANAILSLGMSVRTCRVSCCDLNGVKHSIEVTADPLKQLTTEIESLDGDFSEQSVQGRFENVLARFNMKLGQLVQPVRVALTGGTVSPGIYEVIAVLGRERTVQRLRAAAAKVGA